MEKLLPQNVEAESAVLGSILIDPDAIMQVADYLKPDDFYRDAHRVIYQAALELYEDRAPADLITLTDELARRNKLEEIGGASYVSSLANQVPTSANVDYYGHIVERTAILRRLIHAAGQIAAVAYDEPDATTALDQAEKLIFNISQRFSREDFDHIRETLKTYIDKLEQLHEHRGSIVGVASGFSDLDKITGGLQKSDLIILAARPAVGKTAMSLSLAHNASLRFGKSVAIFSLEMSKEQLVARLLSMDAGVDQSRLRNGYLDDEEWERISDSVGRLSEANIFIDDTPGITLVEMRSKARRLMMEQGFDLMVVDYLQLMQGSGGGRGHENRVQEVSEISRGLKGLARELNVPVLALAQLSRAVESRTDKHPQLSDLRESGCLAGDTLVYLPDEGAHRRIDELVGRSGFNVLALNCETWKLEQRPVMRAFATGRKPVFRMTTRLGRVLRATANHRFRTLADWLRLDELLPGMRLALPRTLPGPEQATMRNEELALHRQNLSRERAARLAQVVKSAPLLALAQSDIYWDEIVSIEPDGEAEVFDLTVDGLHNFVAEGIVCHNSLEQDADIVMFIYRDEVYNENTDRPNIADIIIAKHRNGPVGQVSLWFQAAQTRYRDLEQRRTEDD
ncbi:MAG TPA: replicative DNA helicase [Ktedonobacterales bacterium]|nr:replicative DNA helicase [Ktedonobacterales bacterium]